jgi:transcriptional regulator with XRE-family HTH domain
MARGFETTQAVLAKNLRELREAKGLSQEMLALESEVDRTYVSQIERGVCNPSLRVLHQIALTLKAPISDLLATSDKSR